MNEWQCLGGVCHGASTGVMGGGMVLRQATTDSRSNSAVRRRRRRQDRGYWPSVVLFVLAVVLVLVSYGLLPSDASPSTPASLAFVVQPRNGTKVIDVILSEIQASKDHYKVSIRAILPAEGDDEVYIEGYYPPDDELASCAPVSCDRHEA